MKRKKSVLLSVLSGILTASLLMGCGTSKGGGTDTQKVNNDNMSKQEEAVTIWHDGDEAIMDNIADTVNKELAAEHVSVKFEKKTGLTDQLKLYGSDEANGPDMYLYAHDSLGMLAEMGILAPITDFISSDDEKDMLPMTVEAGTYKEVQYVLPLYYETLLFIYNKDLWKGEIPKTTDDLLTYMKDNTDTAAGIYAVVNQHSTAYNVAPVINGFGGYILDKDAKPGLNDENTIKAVEYNKQFASLMGAGDYDTCNTLFNEKKAAAIVGGPWLISGIKDAGIDYGICSLADFTLPNGNSLAPYSGVQGVGVLKYAEENKKDAITSVLKALCSKDIGITLAKESNCAPANKAAYDDKDVASNDMIMAMKKTAETAQPMPNVVQMSVMWQPAESMLAEINKSDGDVKDAAEKYQEQAETAIKDMQ